VNIDVAEVVSSKGLFKNNIPGATYRIALYLT